MISVGAYGNTAPIPTVSVNALWISNKTVDEELVYQITKALWNENLRKLLDEGHQKGKRIQLSVALKGSASRCIWVQSASIKKSVWLTTDAFQAAAAPDIGNMG